MIPDQKWLPRHKIGKNSGIWTVNLKFTQTVVLLLGSLRNHDGNVQRERHRTKDLMARTMAVHVRFNSWYFSLTSSAKQQREMTKSCVVWRT